MTGTFYFLFVCFMRINRYQDLTFCCYCCYYCFADVLSLSLLFIGLFYAYFTTIHPSFHSSPPLSPSYLISALLPPLPVNNVSLIPTNPSCTSQRSLLLYRATSKRRGSRRSPRQRLPASRWGLGISLSGSTTSWTPWASAWWRKCPHPQTTTPSTGLSPHLLSLLLSHDHQSATNRKQQ